MASQTTVLEGKHIELKDVFNLLESTETQITKSIKNLIQENLASTRESWLVHSLVDYHYASRSNSVVSILTKVQDPHDRFLMEKLHEGIKSPDHQLLALQLLLQIVHKQPTYLKLIVTTQVLKVVIKCLKAENSIPVLMTAVTIITILLPSIPTLFAAYLHDIFEVFNRLASFSVKKPPGNTPDIFLLHLQISVYALFHRLYGMFPYNFLAYLRHFYSKKENLVVFEEVIKGMLERVRLHPSLIIGTKEQEVSAQRWRQMETHDVVVECAKMSLDPIEGTWEELHCPIVNARQLIGRSASPSHEKPGVGLPAKQVSAKLSLLASADSSAAIDLAFWSPSEMIGLSTPPSSQRATPAKALTDMSGATTGQTGPQVQVQSSGTPLNTPRDTPGPDDHDKVRSRNNSRGPLLVRPPDPKRLSSEFTLAPVPQLTPSSHAHSVPPSPLKTEFTNQPPLDVKSLPVYNAARELQFDREHPEDQLGFKPLPSRMISLSQSEGKAAGGSEVKEGSEGAGQGKKEEGQQKVGGEVVEGEAQEGGATATVVREGTTAEAAVSMDTLSQVIENLDSDAGDDGDNDDEVCELTSNARPSGNVSNLTAESVAKFMKSVNRIRFNSLTVTGIEPIAKKMGAKHRSRSCPQFPKIDPMAEEEEEVSRSASTTCEESTQAELEPKSSLDDKATPKESSPEQQVPKAGAPAGVEMGTKQELTVTMTTTQTTTCDIKVTQCPMYQQSLDQRSGASPENDFVHLLQQVLNPAAVTTCDKCRGLQEGRQKADVSSQFSTFSPPELLDRQIRLGGDIHAKELSKLPIPSSQNINWTHFGGVPPADEISILRGQQMLLHNQLLYERHKREQHAKRNRRLLRKIANTKMLEELNKAKSVQLEEHEMMIRDLKVSLKLLQEQNVKLKNTRDSEEYQKLVQLKSCLQENEDLKNVKKEFNMLLVRQREEQEALDKKLKRTEASLFNAKKELETMEQHATMNTRLKEQMLNQQKELLLMGELQQKSQEKLLSQKVSRKSVQEHEKAQEGLKKQLEGLKSQLTRKTTQLEGCQKQLNEAQENLSTKDVAMSELKLTLESLKTSHSDELKSVEDKYQCVLRINQALETQISQLYMEIEEQKFARAQEAKHKKSATTKSPDREASPGSASAAMETPFRDRSGSDPLQKPDTRPPLMRMTSMPAETHMPLNATEGRRSFTASSEHAGTSENSPYVILEESRERDLHGFLDRSGEQDRSETVSLASHDSTLYPGQQHLLYTDSEDNRSMSNRSSRLGDSGFC